VSEGYLGLTLDSGRFTGRLDIPLRDRQSVVPRVVDEKGVIDREQLARHYHELTAYAPSHLLIRLDGRVLSPQLEKTALVLEDLSDGLCLAAHLALSNSFAAGRLRQRQFNRQRMVRGTSAGREIHAVLKTMTGFYL
jgi:hypothetical protein